MRYLRAHFEGRPGPDSFSASGAGRQVRSGVAAALVAVAVLVALSGCASTGTRRSAALVAPADSPAPTVTKTVTAKPPPKRAVTPNKPTSRRVTIAPRQGTGYIAWPGTPLTVSLRQQFRRDVVDVQQAAVNLGYPVGVDGHYGPATASAVAALQRDQGLEVDGIVGQATWDVVQWALGNLEDEQGPGPDRIVEAPDDQGSADPLEYPDTAGTSEVGGGRDLGPGAGSTVLCGDGSISHSGGIQGACSHHGGVS